MRARPFKMMSRSALLAIVGVAGILSIIASGGGGGGGGASTATSTTVPRYAFVVNRNENSVSTYVVDASNGRMKWIGIAATGAFPQSVVVDPSRKYAYVANSNGNSISGYTINSASGALTKITCSTVCSISDFTAGTSPTSITLDPSGKYAYVANFGVASTSVSQYTIGTSGELTPMSAPTATAGTRPYSITIHPSGKYAYVANYGSNNISQFTIGVDGSLAPMGVPSVAAGTNPTSVTVDPSGKYAYVANSGSASVSAYTVDATTGALIPITCVSGCVSPTEFQAGTAPAFIAVDPSGKYVYVANSGSDNSISQYAIGTNGALAANGAAVAAGTAPYAVTVDPSGKFVYVANVNSASVSQYVIDTNGRLTALSPGTAAGRDGPAGITVMAGSAAVQAVPKYAYVTNNGTGVNTVSAYTINSTSGALAQINCGGGAGCSSADFLAGTSPISVAVDPSGRYAYVANDGSTSVSAYTINSTTGALAKTSCISGCTGTDSTAGTNPRSVATDPSGRYVYVANYGGNVSQYAIGTSGALAALTSPVAAGTNPRSVATDPSGRFVYVANYGGNSVSAYTINTTTGIAGALTKIICIGTCTGTDFPAGTNPISVAVDPSGKYAYVTNSGGSNVTPYSIGSDGSLTPIDCDAGTVGTQTCTTGASPFGIAVDPSGKYAYVANNANANVSQYTIGSSGVLALMTSPTIGANLNPSSVTVDPSGKYAYVTNAGSDDIWQYNIGTSGSLASMTPGLVNSLTGAAPSSIATTGTWQ